MTTGDGLGEGARELGDVARAAIVTPVRTPDPAVRREPDTAAPGRRPGSSRWPGRASSLSRVHVALAGVLAVAATVRLVNLNVVGFNSDEAVYAGQAAALAGNPAYADYFPVFRAHPMLVQTFLSVIFRQGEHDVAGRVLVAAFGVATVAVVYFLGRDLYDRRVGLVAAAVLALMPYHVIVTRQVLLDGPMVFFATLTLWWVAKYVKTERLIWMLAAGAALGLTLLAKESSIVLVGSVYAFLALTPAVRRPVVGSLIGVAMALALFAIHPLSAALSGHNSTTKAYLVWQLVRRPNHSFAFYLDVVPPALGLLVLALAVWAVWRARRGPAWREVLLASWLLVPAVAFTLWPVKGFQYLLAGAPAVAVLAARAIVDVDWSRAWARLRLPGPGPSPRMARAGVLAVVTASLLWQLWPAVGKAQGTSGLAATGGVAGARETGHWVRDHTPEGAQFMTIGPSMANLIQFYGHRRAYGLSVSPNPLMRNPSYDPIRNPDARLRQAAFQYVVWDAYSAARSTHFSEQLLTYARRYNGRVIHRELGVRDGRRQPVIVIWAVRP